MSDPDEQPRADDAQLLQLREWGATHRQIAAMLGLRHNTVSVRLSRIDRANRAQKLRDASPSTKDSEDQAATEG